MIQGEEREQVRKPNHPPPPPQRTQSSELSEGNADPTSTGAQNRELEWRRSGGERSGDLDRRSDRVTSWAAGPDRGAGFSHARTTWRTHGEYSHQNGGGGRGCEHRYTKRQLLLVYDRLLAHKNLALPDSVEMPVGLSEAGAKMGSGELSEDKWVVLKGDGDVSGPFNRNEIVDGMKSGGFKTDFVVAPWAVFRERGVSVGDLLRTWEEKDRVDMEPHGESSSTQSEVVIASDDGSRAKISNGEVHKTKEASPSPSPTPPQKPGVQCAFDGFNVLSPEIGCDNWRYLDQTGHLQGPFTVDQLQDWWRQGFLNPDLKLKPESLGREEFLTLYRVLLSWFKDCETWTYKDPQGNVQGPFPKSALISWFDVGALPFDLPLQPETWAHKSEFFPLIDWIVFWMPFSDSWSCKDGAGKDFGTVELEKVPTVWEKECACAKNMLFVKPSAWTGGIYMPIERLLEAYGYLQGQS